MVLAGLTGKGEYMKRIGRAGILAMTVLVGVLAVIAQTGGAQRPAAQVATTTAQAAGTTSRAAGTTAQAATAIDALLVSDIHFDPFMDPAKTEKLAVAPVESWQAILDAEPSADRDARLGGIEKSCHTRGVDTDEALFNASLRAMRTEAHAAGFVTVSGDLMAHAFDCKFHAVFPKATDDDYAQFSLRTLEYIQLRLRQTLRGVPVYAALGNNDSGCGDYRLDAHSPFLAAAARSFTADVPQAERARAVKDFSATGSYVVSLPGARKGAQLLVIDDLFLSRKYTGCSGKSDAAPGRELVDWLRQQIEQARAADRPVWVMGHIPTGVDPFSTTMKMRNVCGGQAPEMFLSSADLPDLLSGSGDVVRLAVFAHTHMDEMRLLTASGGAPVQLSVAMKMVPSISPINGNLPSFTVARVDAATAALKDYRVVVSSDAKGSSWNAGYDYGKTYGKADYSASALAGLMGAMLADPNAQSPVSQAYLRAYYVRDASAVLKMFWPQYLCSLENYTAESYRDCLCKGAH
jgi:sphingomyelin phosphodiesterase acid-like 3